MENNSYLFKLVYDISCIAKKSGEIFKNAHAKNVYKKLNARDLVPSTTKLFKTIFLPLLKLFTPRFRLLERKAVNLKAMT